MTNCITHANKDGAHHVLRSLNMAKGYHLRLNDSLKKDLTE
jgi:hypothetical protein